MIDWVSTKTDEVTTLFRNVSVLGAIIMVAIAYYKTRTIVALIVAAITAGVFLWTINNTDWWTDRVEEETEVRGSLESLERWDVVGSHAVQVGHLGQVG